MQQYLRILSVYPDFRRLWLANVISLAGDWFNTIVMSALVVRYSPGREGTAISLLLLARFVPPMIISPLGGVLIDNLNRKHLLIASNLLRALVVLSFLWVIDNPALLWVVYLLNIVQFVLGAVFEPGQASMIPSLVAQEDWVQANTLFNVTWSVMLAFGAAVGGLVTTLFGAAFALAVDALTFLLGAWLIWRIKSYTFTPPKARQRAASQRSGGLVEGLRFLRRMPQVSTTLLVKFGTSIGNVDALMTIFATQIFVIGQDGQGSLGIMYATFGLGAILGPLLLNRWNDGQPQTMRGLIRVGLLSVALGWVVISWSATLVILLIGLLLRAMGGSANWTYSTIIIQKTTPNDYLGRVFSLDMMAFYVATVASTLIHGQLIDYFGAVNVRNAALVMFVPAVLIFVVWTWIARRVGQRYAPMQETVTGD